MPDIDLRIDGLEGGTDADAPYLYGRVPGDGDPDVVLPDDGVDQYLRLFILDADAGVDLSTVVIRIKVGAAAFATAYTAEAFDPDYDKSGKSTDAASVGTPDPGFQFDIFPLTPFAQGTTIQIEVTARDLATNLLDAAVYSFTTSVPPYVSLRDPGAGETAVPIYEPVIVAVKDDYALDPDGTAVYVAGTLAFDADAGGFQPTFAGTYLETVAGLEWTVTISTHPVWDEGQLVSVRVLGADANGATVDDTQNLTARNQPPFVSGLDPGQSEVVGVAHDIYLEIRDLDSGVDLATVTVDVNVDAAGWVRAYTGSTDLFSGPYDGAGSVRGVLADGLSLNIDPDPVFDPGQSIQIRVNALDLAGNTMVEVVYAFDVSDGPVISNLTPTGAGAATDADIGFRALDDDGVDLTSIDITLQGLDAVVDGVAQTGYTLATTPVAGGHDVAVGIVEGLALDTTYSVTAHVQDSLGAGSDASWSFATDQGAVAPLRLWAAAGNANVRLWWTFPPPAEALQERFLLRRSFAAFPTSPDEGDLVYQGTGREFTDLDVENGRLYYYTVFVARRPDDYAPYEATASKRARPRETLDQVVVFDEYVPARGDFGAKTVDPTPSGQVTDPWTLTGRQSDVVTMPAPTFLRSPVRGTVRMLSGTRVEIETFDTRMVLAFDGVMPLSSTTVGAIIEAGEVFGRSLTNVVEFGIHRLQDGEHGQRTVRPQYFYLTIENRDGSG